ncbi:MAG: phosphotransferase family protein [Lysobacterales bacterium 69-70]|nr:phosphotransferase [Xanthomonadaceae bacterium]ODU35207.1 MAG: aminoglycoside phosphotransferase [Xanthomonadaceae bacterium SCN 69-320]ODV15789.1 MAG: aminoglycoside phosphotransferase [Xanthomonadaceae bacterium SCN 69-25]OJY94107.1 MAG: phosphotransferase family protein [Xanthomonadales bacterium 69-70]
MTPASDPGFDTDVLAAYLQARMPGFRGPLGATKFKGGQSNPTYRIDAASGCYVLRRKPPGKLLASAHAVDREYRVLRALEHGTVPVASPLHLCEDAGVIGSAFYLMSYVPGRVYWDPALPELAPAQRGAIYDAALDSLIALAGLDVAAAGLADYGKPGNYFARQIARWSEQYRASETTTIAAMDRLIAALPAAAPADDGRIALVHGDFRLDNLMWSDEPRLLAVVDWELSTLGHPLADLGYFCMALRLPRNPVLPGLAGMDRAALGIPDEAALLARFAAATGLDPGDAWPFHLAFHFFRLAAIAQGVMQRALQGNASNEQALAAGRMAATIAQMGWEVLDR